MTTATGKADAERFLKILQSKQLEYPVYMDNEAQPASAKADITEATIAFCETMGMLGTLSVSTALLFPASKGVWTTRSSRPTPAG